MCSCSGDSLESFVGSRAAWQRQNHFCSPFSEEKKPKPSIMSQEEGKSGGYGTGWGVMTPDLPG